MVTSEKVDKLIPALLEFQKQVGVIRKDAINPHYKNQYASLPAILAQVTPILLAQGIVLVQAPINQYEIETTLIHTSGQFMTSSFYMKPSKDDPQGIGGAITYGRRYAIAAMLSLAIDEDDDGNTASGKPVQSSSSNSSSNSSNSSNGTTSQPWLKEGTMDFLVVKGRVEKGEYKNIEDVRKEFKVSSNLEKALFPN